MSLTDEEKRAALAAINRMDDDLSVDVDAILGDDDTPAAQALMRLNEAASTVEMAPDMEMLAHAITNAANASAMFDFLKSTGRMPYTVVENLLASAKIMRETADLVEAILSYIKIPENLKH